MISSAHGLVQTDAIAADSSASILRRRRQGERGEAKPDDDPQPALA
jgi:hypothetical protein